MTQQAFDTLLNQLDPDREIAGAQFEALRHKLLRFFNHQSCAFPDRWADETLDRVAKRLSEGSPVAKIDIFALGVAGRVLREARVIETRQAFVKELPTHDPAAKERDAACLGDCLARLPEGARELIEQYYLGIPESRSAARKTLAASMGVSSEALRHRALRVRRQLETCLLDCREKHARE